MKVIALIAQKGGTGKTTLACALACALAKRAPTTLLDLDPQGSATHWGIRRQANGAGPPKVVPVTVRSLSAFIQERSENGDGAVVIDTPPHTQSGVLNAGVLADLVLIPTRPAIHDVLGIAATISLCRDNRIKAPVYVLVNQAAPQGRRNQDFVQRLKDYGIPVSPHLVVRRVAHEDSAITGQSAAELAPKEPAARELNALYRWTEGLLYNGG